MTDANQSWILVRRSSNGSGDPEAMGRFGTFEAAKIEAIFSLCDHTPGETTIERIPNGDSETAFRARGGSQVFLIRPTRRQ